MSLQHHVVSFSGGRTSAFLVYLMEQRRKNEGIDVTYIFMDTGAEHPKTYEFIKNVVKYWGIKLICLRASIPLEKGKGPEPVEIPLSAIGWDLQPWREMLAKYGPPYIGGAFCTDRMKTAIFRKYCNKRFGRYKYYTWLGIRSDEPSRLEVTDDPRRFGVRFLAEINDAEKPDILRWWKRQPFDLGIEEWLGNCVFCIKKGLNKVALAAKDEPELARDFLNLLHEETVKSVERKYGPLIMYRSKNSLESVIETYRDVSRADLIARLRGQKALETGSCTDSCEILGCNSEATA